MDTKQKKQILVRVAPEVRKKLRHVASENDTSLQVVVEEILNNHVSEKK